MTLFMTFWSAWAYIFRGIPNGDPYVAAFALVVLGVYVVKALRSIQKYVLY